MPTCPTCLNVGHHNHSGETETCGTCFGDPRELCECGCGFHHTKCEQRIEIDGWRFLRDDLSAFHRASGVQAFIDARGITTTSRHYDVTPAVAAEMQRRFAEFCAKSVAA